MAPASQTLAQMTPAHQRLMEVLLRYLSPGNAEGTLSRSIQEAGLKAEAITSDDLPRLLPALDRRLRIYLDPVKHARISAELATIGAERPQRRARTVTVKIELDISEARKVAKDVCEGAAARSFIVHKVVTIVSELARNIVHYTPGRHHRGRARARHARALLGHRTGQRAGDLQPRRDHVAAATRAGPAWAVACSG